MFMIPLPSKFKKISYHRFLKFFRLFLLFFTLSSYLYWSYQHLTTPPLPIQGEKMQVFASQCDEDLCPRFLSAIKSAQDHIHLSVYTLSEKRVIEALKERADSGVDVSLILDKSSPNKMKSSHNIKRQIRDINGLMHRKILVIDHEKVFIGSANFTNDSLHLDDNLVAAFSSQELSQDILQMQESHPWIGGQKIDFYPLPSAKKPALHHLLSLLEKAKSQICVAMFTLTHPLLLEKLIAAHRRGVHVEVVVDRKSSDGASKKGVKRLIEAGIPVRLSCGSQTFHHKLGIIDGKRVAFGSANWTKAAFSHNEECLLIVEELSEEQIEKFKKLWHAIRCTSE
jgi:phosphatidylserine/phosphatidylglycerophosphate/cardiolipin synthase-like enzyme